MNTWHTLKGYLAGAIALIACPCHLPITFPLILSLTAGTALGSWLEGKFGLVIGVSTVIFLGGLGLAMLWSGNEKIAVQPQPNRKPAPPRRIAAAPVTVTIVTSSTCQSCGQAKSVWEQVGQERPLRIEVVEINTAQGRELAAQHHIFTTPASLVNGTVVARGVPMLQQARRAAEVGSEGV